MKEYEISEPCPHCDMEIGIIWDVEADGYQVYCPNCGKKIMLCSVCPNANSCCDWHIDVNGKSNCKMM